jgi:hypothetical protein
MTARGSLICEESWLPARLRAVDLGLHRGFPVLRVLIGQANVLVGPTRDIGRLAWLTREQVTP